MSAIILIENNEYELDQLKIKLKPHFEEIMAFCKDNGITNRKKDIDNKIVTFSFVGCLILKSSVILFLPKYFKESYVVNEQHYMKLLLQVLQKYQKSIIENPLDFEITNKEDEHLHLFGLISYLIQSYIEYGLYVKEYNEKVYSGDLEIDWQTTIDQGTPYLTKLGAPVYLDLVREMSEYDLSAPITCIHKSILNECTNLAKSWGIDEILDWPRIYFDTDENWLKKPKESIYWIKKEMQTEFQDRNLLLLKNLLLFIEKINSMDFKTNIMLIGSKYFHIIWEKCCSDVFQHNRNIQQYIKRPVWESAGYQDKTKKTLLPDFLKLLESDNSKSLIIFDAKYYAIEFQENRVKHHPGIEDVVKQYMYNQSLKKYIQSQNIANVYNAFLFPSLENEEIVFGKVKLDFMPADLSPIFLIKLNAEDIFKTYINGRNWSTNRLRDLLRKIDKY